MRRIPKNYPAKYAVPRDVELAMKVRSSVSAKALCSGRLLVAVQAVVAEFPPFRRAFLADWVAVRSQGQRSATAHAKEVGV